MALVDEKETMNGGEELSDEELKEVSGGFEVIRSSPKNENEEPEPMRPDRSIYELPLIEPVNKFQPIIIQPIITDEESK